MASGGFELRLGTDRETGDAVLRAGWHKSPPDPAAPLPAHLTEATRPQWTDAEVRQLLARLPAREHRRVRWAAIHAGCAGAEWQRRLLVAAKFLFALPIVASLVLLGRALASMAIDPITVLVSVALSLVSFSPSLLLFGLLFFVVREWAVRTAKPPLGDEFEVLLNRVYPLRRQITAAGPASAPGADGDGFETEVPAERAAFERPGEAGQARGHSGVYDERSCRCVTVAE